MIGSPGFVTAEGKEGKLVFRKTQSCWEGQIYECRDKKGH